MKPVLLFGMPTKVSTIVRRVSLFLAIASATLVASAQLSQSTGPVIRAATLNASVGMLEKNTATGAVSTAGGPVWISSFNQVNNYSSASITGGGHQVAVFGMAYNVAAGTTNALAIGVEGTVGNGDGTITKGVGVLGTLNGNSAGKTISLWVGANAVPANNAGTLTKAQGFRAEVTSGNTGTIGEWAGFYNADASTGVGTITTRYAFVNDDAGAVFKSKAPFVDSSLSSFIPTNGGTTTIPANVGTIILNSGATIASSTLALPGTGAPAVDGQEITFFSVYQITSLSVSATGYVVIGAPATLAAGGFFKMKHVQSGPYWIRVG